MWRVSPMNPANNVNGLGPSVKEHVLTLDASGGLLPVQEALARLPAPVLISENAPYRMEAWEFILAGGGLFNHLDYSFTVGHEDGTFRFPPTQPGGGGPSIRRQLRVLRDFVLGFDFVRMKPDPGFVREGVPAGGSAQALVETGRAYALYLRRVGAEGAFSARWTGLLVPPVSGEYALHTSSNDGVRVRLDDRVVIEDWTDHSEKEEASIPHAGGPLRLGAPAWTDDVAVAIRRVEAP